RDLMQESFLRAARSLSSVPIGDAREEAWLVRVLINIQRDIWRKKAVRQRLAPTLAPDTCVRPEEERTFITKHIVWQALDRLVPRRRAVLVMHEIEGMQISAV